MDLTISEQKKDGPTTTDRPITTAFNIIATNITIKSTITTAFTTTTTTTSTGFATTTK